MSFPTKEEILNNLKEREKVLSTRIDFDDLVEKGILEKKKAQN